MPLNEYIDCTLVVALIVISIGAMSGIARRFKLHPEVARKSLHVSLGLLALALPWAFSDLRPVMIVAAASLAFLTLLRSSPQLRMSLGHSLHAVKRNSLGEIYFVLGISIAVLTARNSIDYAIAILILTFADPAAAAVGMRFGRHPYGCPDGRKSLEGSVAFFVIAVLVPMIILETFTAIAMTEAWCLSVTLAAICTLAEAFAGKGRDNIAVPVAGLLTLHYPDRAGVLLLLLLLVIGVLRLYLNARTFRARPLQRVFN